MPPKAVGGCTQGVRGVSRLESAVGLIMCGKESETMLQQSSSLSNDVDRDPHIVAWRKFLTNEEDWEKCVDAAKETILSWSAGGRRKESDCREEGTTV